MIGVEILVTADTRGRGVRLLQGLHDTAIANGFKPRMTTSYEGSLPWLMLWGPGDPLRYRSFQSHVKAGGTAVAWDMGYWASGRGQDVLGLNRLTVNAMHPHALLTGAEWSAERLATYPVAYGDTYDPNGHIVLAGLGPKTLLQYGLRVGEWEARALAQIRRAFPGRRVLFRPKPQNLYQALDVDTDSCSPIEQVLAGAALVVARHSNVAIDAIRYGIPACVEDGAAAASFGNDLAAEHRPLTHEARMRFLQNVAWLQWSIAEAWNGLPWGFLRRAVSTEKGDKPQ